MKFKIENIDISNNTPARIICEIGINHDGKIDKAIALVDAAIESGAEILKHQTHIADEEMSIEAKTIIPSNANESIYNVIKKRSLNEADEIKLQKYIKSKKKIFISTPFSFAAVDRLVKMNVPAFKIGSGECNNYPLIKYITKFKKPIIMSTGMNLISDISKSVNIIKKSKVPFAILHCTNIYPTPSNLIKIDTITELKKKFPRVLVGYSDHHNSIEACLSAMTLGACIIEKHFVLSKKNKGPDVSSSMDPKDLSYLIKMSETIFKLKGFKKKISNIENKTSKFAFASVVSKIDIKKDELFTYKNLTLKRPSGGAFGPKDFRSLIGKKARINVKKNLQIKNKMVRH